MTLAPAITTITALRRGIAAGWRYEWCPANQVSQETAWHQYWLIEPNGTLHPVRTGIAIAAWRKGLAKPEEAVTCQTS